ncbi:MAG: TonB-dependent copper receptor [Puniceicoccales bacterium]|jgi:iron complex outermembrane receptor protein|nr:TonB-dependent copper receptor [Puniceicoccales bacterium]
MIPTKTNTNIHSLTTMKIFTNNIDSTTTANRAQGAANHAAPGTRVPKPAALRPHRKLLLAAAVLLTSATPGVHSAEDEARPPAEAADGIVRIDPVVVSAPRPGDTPLVAILDTQSAARPGPAQDGADILRDIPGVNISRKGGTGGEVFLRGAGGSRLNLLLDHESILGGCPGRMDPPSAYIFPGDFESVTVLKGPSAVSHGPGNSAGVILFKSPIPRFEAPGAHATLATGYGTANRNDQQAAITVGIPQAYAKFDYSRTAADDYRDGTGTRVHSNYDRQGARAAIGWTPDTDTLLEAHASLATGHAAYAHSAMDAARLDRLGTGLRFEKKNISPVLQSVEIGAYHNAADHVMDNFTLRPPPTTGMMAGGTSSNVSHTLYGGRALATLAPATGNLLTPGLDFTLATHDQRSGTRASSYKNNTRNRDASLDTIGIFLEDTHHFSPASRLNTGLRLNAWFAKDHRAPQSAGGGMGGGMGGGGKATGGQDRDDWLPSAFIRYEHDLAAPLHGLSLYANLGHTTRAPDYWELFSYESTNTNSAFLTKPERTTQLDLGTQYKHGPFALRLSLFGAAIDDYILAERRANPATGATRALTRNITAATIGGELTAAYTLELGGGQLQIDATLSYVRGHNRSDSAPLAQLPPLEGRLALGYVHGNWSFGATARAAATQHRHAINQGTVTGYDLGPTPAFATLDLNIGYPPRTGSTSPSALTTSSTPPAPNT